MSYRQVELAGQVRRRTVNVGSKSEHTAVMLDTNQGESYELRVSGSDPFEPSSDLADLVGQRIVTRGVASDNTLLMQEWHPEGAVGKDAAFKPAK